MTIVRSVGVTTIVALMAAHRIAAMTSEAPAGSPDQQAVAAVEAGLRALSEPSAERHDAGG